VNLAQLRKTNTGAAMAIAAGVFVLAVTSWPVPATTSTRGDLTAVWATAVRLLGVAVVAAPFLASLRPRRLGLAKLLAAAGGIGLVAAGVAAVLTGGGLGELLLGAAPGGVGLAAAWLLGPLRRPEVERAARAEALGRAQRGEHRG
jgi:hypothetical protein